MTSSVLNVKVLVAHMKTVIAAIAEYDRHIEALCQTHQDCELFASLPGAGPVHAARLTDALGSDRSRWQTADELLRFSGIAPVIDVLLSMNSLDQPAGRQNEATTSWHG